MNDNTNDIFNESFSQRYDECNSRIGAIGNSLYLLIPLVLNALPENARLLCVGAGTGREIIQLAERYPHWRFTAVDPSAPMLSVCEQKLKERGLEHRCQLITGYLNDVPKIAHYDAALSIMVAHFIRDLTARQRYFRDILSCLVRGGRLIQAEISVDPHSRTFEQMFPQWRVMQELMAEEAIDADTLKTTMRTRLGLLAPEITEQIMIGAGFRGVQPFWQGLFMRAWFADKPAR